MTKKTDHMTPRERIMAAVRHEPHDRVPVCPRLNTRVVGQIGLEAAKLLMEEVEPCWVTAIGNDLDFFVGKQGRERLTVSAQNGDQRSVLHTPLGDLERISRADRARGTTWGIKDFIENKEDVEKFKSIPYVPAEPDTDDYLAACLLAGEDALVQVSIPSAINMPAGWMPPTTFNVYSIEERELIFELLAMVNERILDFIGRAVGMGVRYFWMYGPEYAGPPLMHPRCYDLFAKPFDKEIVDAVHKVGGVLHTHMHGKVRAVLGPLADTGTDVISPLEAPPMGEIDLAEALPAFGKRVCLMGNLDDYSVIDSGDLAMVRRRAEAAVIARNESGGDLLLGGTDDSCRTPNMVEGFREMGRVSRELSKPR